MDGNPYLTQSGFDDTVQGHCSTVNRFYRRHLQMQTSFVYNPLFLNHDTGSGHPERSARLTAAYELLNQQPWYNDLRQTEVRIAESVWIDLVHPNQYEKRIQAACEAGESYIDTPDVAVSLASYDVATKAAGSVLAITDQVISGEVDNGFAMIRPPGHHAEANQAMGFCLFNNVAAAVRAAAATIPDCTASAAREGVTSSVSAKQGPPAGSGLSNSAIGWSAPSTSMASRAYSGPGR